MASQTRQAREADRKLSVQTLAIASVSSAAAAIIVSQFWKSGTAPAAAFTPVVVSVVSEMLHKPTQAIKSKVTAERTALLPEGVGAGAPPQRVHATVGGPARDFEADRPASEERPPPLHDEDGDAVPSDERATREPPITYHRAGTNGKTAPAPRRKFPVKVVAATAALAFVIGAAILTIPELIGGGAVGKPSGGTTLFGGSKTSDTAGQKDSGQRDQPTSQGSDQQGSQDKSPSSQSQDSKDSQQKQTQQQSQTTKQQPQQKQAAPQPQQQQSAPSPQQKAPAQP